MPELPPPQPTPPTDPPARPGPPALRRFSRRRDQAGGPLPPAGPAPAAEPSARGATPPGGAGPGAGYDWPTPTPAGPAGTARSRRGLVLAPLATVVAVAAVAAGVVVLRHDGSGASLRPLALLDAGQAEDAAAAPGSMPGPGVAGADYRIEGTLPTGPARAQVRTFPTSSGGQAPAGDVTKLAEALGLTARPTRASGGWTVTSGGRTLRVLDGAGWQWVYSSATDLPTGGGMACDVIVNGRRLCMPGGVIPGGGGKVIPIDPPAANPGGGAGANGSTGTASGSARSTKPGSGPIAVDPAPGAGSGPGTGSSAGTGPDSGSSGGGSTGSGGGAAPGNHEPADGATAVPLPVDPVPIGPRPDEAAVRKAATDVLTALGLDAAAARVDGYPGFAQVTATPVVAGVPTSGYETRLRYDARITLTGGSGWLATSAAGADYPLISAQRAFDALPKPAIGRACTDVAPSKCTTVAMVVTGARLGLALRHDQQIGALLVPAWLYTLRGSTLPLVAIAVDPAYLGPAVRGGPPPAIFSPTPGQVANSAAPGGPPIPKPRQTK